MFCTCSSKFDRVDCAWTATETYWNYRIVRAVNIMPKLMLVLSVAVATTLYSTTVAFRINNNARRSTTIGRQRSIALADMSILHDPASLLDAFHHAVNIATVPHADLDSLHSTMSFHSTLPLADAVAIDAIPDPALPVVEEEKGLYKVDKTGFIGFFADIFEQAIDLLHNIAGGKGSYGIAIVFFTFLSEFRCFHSLLISTYHSLMHPLTPRLSSFVQSKLPQYR